jgi:hypothetical protein
MQYVLLASHSAEICPTSNGKTREMVNKLSPMIPELARKHGVKIIAGPLVSQEHISTMIVEVEKGESLDQFLEESRLGHWNRVKIIPSVPLAQGMQDTQKYPPTF